MPQIARHGEVRNPGDEGDDSGAASGGLPGDHGCGLQSHVLPGFLVSADGLPGIFTGCMRTERPPTVPPAGTILPASGPMCAKVYSGIRSVLDERNTTLTDFGLI